MIDFFRALAESVCGYSLSGVSDFIIATMGIIAILITIAFIVSSVIQLYLSISYVKYNKRKNSIGMTGENIARKILDDNGLQNIKVKSSGSILFGNSYSHFFKKVRLRRLTWKKDSISSLAMASQKSCLAILDKENDPDMRTRIILTPLTYFGPLFCIPLILIGIIIDLFIIKNNTLTFTFACTSFGIVLYLISFIMSLKILKTEIKAQNKAYQVLKNDNMATDEELIIMKKLFQLYNIEYINNMVISLLELVYRILQIFAAIQQSNND